MSADFLLLDLFPVEGGFAHDVEFIINILPALRDSGPFLEHCHLILITAPHPPHSLQEGRWE